MIIVAIDYFTKWIEAEALSSTEEADVEQFIWRNIICRFGFPQSLVTDNGLHFLFQNVSSIHKTQLLPISSVLRKTQGTTRSVLRETQPRKSRPKGDAGCAKSFLKWGLHAPCGRQDSHTRHSRDAAHKKRPKGDAGCARNFLKGGLHAFCGKYPGSYPFPKGGRIVIQLPISSVLRETQGDDQAILRDMQNTPGVLQ
ncbi:unnamed protein product, partial [Prunus brigantina]